MAGPSGNAAGREGGRGGPWRAAAGTPVGRKIMSWWKTVLLFLGGVFEAPLFDAESIVAGSDSDSRAEIDPDG